MGQSSVNKRQGGVATRYGEISILGHYKQLLWTLALETPCYRILG